MLTLVLWQHVVFLRVSRTLFRMRLVMVVRLMLCSVSFIRCTTITRLILNGARLTRKNTTCCHSTKVNITK